MVPNQGSILSFYKKSFFWDGKKAPAGMGTPQHPGFKKKTHFFGEKKAPAGMGTPQHPGFKKKHTFGAEKKPMREWGHRNTLVLN